jgi:hypothetical protein
MANEPSVHYASNKHPNGGGGKRFMGRLDPPDFPFSVDNVAKIPKDGGT